MYLPLKIIHFIASIDNTGGGTTTYMQLLSTELEKQVDLVVATGHSPRPIDMNGVRVKFFDMSPVCWFLLNKEFASFFKAEQPDLVHVNGIWNPENALFQKVAQSLGIKVILSPHGMLALYILNRHPIRKQLALWFYKHKASCNADCLHATATIELDQFRKLGYLQQTIVIPNGIDLSYIVKKKWSENQPIQKLLFLSRVHPKKGIEYLIKAIKKVGNRNLLIAIAGDGDAKYVESLNELAKQENVADQFRFIGGIYGDEKWLQYCQSDLFVLPTFSENFGVVIAEALATGLPVITTKCTPWVELESEKCGCWIDLCVFYLADSISKLLTVGPSVALLMGIRGQGLVAAKYDIKSVANKLIEKYQMIV